MKITLIQGKLGKTEEVKKFIRGKVLLFNTDISNQYEDIPDLIDVNESHRMSLEDIDTFLGNKIKIDTLVIDSLNNLRCFSILDLSNLVKIISRHYSKINLILTYKTEGEVVTSDTVTLPQG